MSNSEQMTPDESVRVGTRAADLKRSWWQTGLVLTLVAAALGTLFASLLSSGGQEQRRSATPVPGGNFTARTVDGTQFPIPGSKPSVLLFFSIECGACGPATKVLAEVQRGAPEEANFVAVDLAPYETVEEIKAFLAENDASSLAFASDMNARLITAYQINQVSTAVVLDATGSEVFRAVEPSAAELRTALATALAIAHPVSDGSPASATGQSPGWIVRPPILGEDPVPEEQPALGSGAHRVDLPPEGKVDDGL